MMDCTTSRRRRSSPFSKLSRPHCCSDSMTISHSPTITSPSRAVFTSTQPSRSNSSSSLSSLGLDTTELKERAIEALTTLYDPSAYDQSPNLRVHRHIHPDMSIEHEGMATSHNPTISSWPTWISSLRSLPEVELHVAGAIVDESQRKVRVRSLITGLPDGRRKESYDVMSFDESGVLVSLTGEWRSLRRGEEEDFFDCCEMGD